MRPVNLIPPEQRRGERVPLRSGPLAYLLVVALGVALAAVTALVVTGNQIADREAEQASLEGELASAQADAEALAPYAEFASLQEARRATVSTLAQSRFDWERVLRELAIVMPEDVWIVKVTGTASPDVQLEDGAEVATRATVPGPALALVGCGGGQEAVARFAAALRDIDGVTRVGVQSSERPEESQAATEGPADAGGDECRTRDFVAKFEIVVAFDEVPVPTTAAGAGAAPAAPASTADESAVADAQQQEAQAAESAESQTEQAQEATDVVAGTVR